MEIQAVDNIGSDSDITVIMLKKSLKASIDLKDHFLNGDGKGPPNVSLINLVGCKQEDNHDVVSTDCSLKPLSSWDQDNDDTEIPIIQNNTMPHTENLFKISEERSGDSIVLKTIQNTYAESELTLYSESNNTTFVDINLQESSENIQKDKTLSRDHKSKSKNSLISSCFCCVLKKRPSETGLMKKYE